MKFMRYDSPFMMGLAKVTDLIMINIYTTLLCLPIVTAGAAITALHYMSLKIVRDEYSAVTKEYFKSFATNFKQATLIWLMVLGVLAVLVGDFLIVNFSGLAFGKVLKIALIVIACLLAFVYVFIYPILAKFDNTIKNTIKNAVLIGILQFPKTILMMIVGVLPLALALLFPGQCLPLVLLFGFSGPAWVDAKLYNKYFKMLEDQVIEREAQERGEVPEEEESIFKDEPYEDLPEETK